MSKNFKTILNKKINESKNKDTVLSVRVPKGVYEKLEKIAKSEGVTVSLVVLAALEGAVEEYHK